MAARPRYRTVLRLVVVVISFAAVGLSSVPAEAHNVWYGGYRKWPWKAGTDVALSTLPGECPHCPAKQSSSSWKAIDAEMWFETVYSIGPGTVDAIDSTGSSNAGRYVRVRDTDGTFITYEHLSSISVPVGQTLAPGQAIGVSGDTGNVSGPHLHFQRHDGPSFGSNALALTPISGHGGTDDPLARTTYTSDNAGIGSYPSGATHAAFASGWRAYGGYNFGVSANIGDLWSPCREDTVYGTWWRYACSPVSGTGGSIQTFYRSSQPRALMVLNGTTTAYAVMGGILGAYTEMHNGHDWVYWIGYPRTNRYKTGTDAWRQDFQRGSITFRPSACEQSVYWNGAFMRAYGFCD